MLVLVFTLPVLLSGGIYLYVVFFVKLYPVPLSEKYDWAGSFVRMRGEDVPMELLEQHFGAAFEPDVIMGARHGGVFEGISDVFYSQTVFAACQSWEEGIRFSESGTVTGGVAERDPEWDVMIIVRAGFPTKSFEGMMYGKSVATGVEPGGESIVDAHRDEWSKSGAVVIEQPQNLPRSQAINWSTVLQPARPQLAPYRPIWHLTILNYVILLAISFALVLCPLTGYRRIRTSIRRQQGRCVQCGHVLMKQHQNRCPECGCEISS